MTRQIIQWIPWDETHKTNQIKQVNPTASVKIPTNRETLQKNNVDNLEELSSNLKYSK